MGSPTISLLAAGVLLGTGLAASPALASSESPPQISDVTVQHSVHVDGLEVGYVDITARITSVDGRSTGGGPDRYQEMPSPYVELSPSGPHRRWFRGSPGWWPMDRISGDDHDGVWRARVPFTSTAVGSWEVRAVVTRDATETVTRQPVTDGAITVTSPDTPRLEWTANPAVQRPDEVGRVTFSGRLMWTNGSGVAGVTLRWAQELACVENDGEIGTLHTVRTDPAGLWSFTADQHDGVVCLGWYAPAPDASTGGYSWPWGVARYGATWLSTALQYVLSTPVDAETTAGEAVALNGKAYPSFKSVGRRVLLQRYTAGRWKTVGSAPVRSSGRYTLTAQPPYAGRHAYRVWKPSDDCTEGHCLELGTVSATFAVSAG